MARSLSKHLKDLKVIHLVRDPRSVVWSRAMLSLCDKSISGLFMCATYYCKKALENRNVLLSELPDSHLTVRYEDIASRPVPSVKRMYDFIGLTLTNDIAKFAHEVTLGGNRSECAVCRIRWQMSNTNNRSDTRLNALSNILQIDKIRAMEEPCLEFMEKFGYARAANASAANGTYFF